MIRIENISKSNSHRILFIEASAALNKGEKIGLVGPNGAGKTTPVSYTHLDVYKRQTKSGASIFS